MEVSLISNPTPGGNTVGLAWDETNDELWASDQEKRAIFRKDEGGGWNEALSWDGVPGPIAVDSSRRILWVVDEAIGKIVRVDMSTSELSIGPGIGIPHAALREVPSITGLAWDERYLWLSTGCGLCSTIFWIDVESGEVVGSIYPYCIPRGLAFRGGGGRNQAEVWSVAFNGARPAVAARYPVPNPPGYGGISPDFYRFMTMSGPARILAGAPPVNPTAVSVVRDQTLHTDRLLVVDNETDVIREYELPTPYQLIQIVQ